MPVTATTKPGPRSFQRGGCSFSWASSALRSFGAHSETALHSTSTLNQVMRVTIVSQWVYTQG